MSDHPATEGSPDKPGPAQWEPMFLKRIGTFGDILQGFSKNGPDGGASMTKMVLG